MVSTASYSVTTHHARSGRLSTHYLRDSLHGDVGLYPIEYSLLQCIEVQRLTRLRPLHFVPLVFPGATHSQFSHALGVVATLQRVLKDSNVPLSPRDRRVLRIAALLHDCSHMAHENVLRPALSQSRQIQAIPRRKAIEALFDGTMNEWWTTYQPDAMAALGEPKFVSDVLKGDVAKRVRSVLLGEAGHMSELLLGLAKDREHVTVEQLDFIRRDSRELGLEAASYDDAIFSAFEIIKDENETQHITIRDNPIVLSSVEDVIYARWHLSRHAYLHHAVVSAGTMLDAAVESTIELSQTACLQVLDDEELLRYILERRAPFTDDRALHDDLPKFGAGATSGQQIAARLIHRRLYKRAYAVDPRMRHEAEKKLTPRMGNRDRKSLVERARNASNCEILIGEPIFAHTPGDYSTIRVGKGTLREALTNAGLDQNIGNYAMRYRHLDVFYVFTAAADLESRRRARERAEEVFGPSDYYVLRAETSEELRAGDTWEELFNFVDALRQQAPGTLPILRMLAEEESLHQTQITGRLGTVKATTWKHLQSLIKIQEEMDLEIIEWRDDRSGEPGGQPKLWSIPRASHREMLKETLGPT